MAVIAIEQESTSLEPLDRVLEAMGPPTADKLIPMLQQIQEAYGYLPQHALLALSRRAGIPASRIYGVATFYEQFHMQPRGRHVVRCCRGTACHVKGGADIIAALEVILQVEPGRTTEDKRFTLETVPCVGTCFLAPAMMVDGDYYGNLTPEELEAILERYD